MLQVNIAVLTALLPAGVTQAIEITTVRLHGVFARVIVVAVADGGGGPGRSGLGGLLNSQAEPRGGFTIPQAPSGCA